MTAQLVKHIVSQDHQLPGDSLTMAAQLEMKEERTKFIKEKTKRMKETPPSKTQRALDLASEKDRQWTLLPLKEMGLDLHKKEFVDGLCL